MGNKPIKKQSGESEKNKSSDSKVFFVMEDSDEATEALLDEMYGPEEKEEEQPTPGAK